MTCPLCLRPWDPKDRHEMICRECRWTLGGKGETDA